MKRAFTNCIILDGTENMAPKTGNAVLVKDGVISGIVPEKEVPADFEKTDLGGKYILN